MADERGGLTYYRIDVDGFEHFEQKVVMRVGRVDGNGSTRGSTIVQIAGSTIQPITRRYSSAARTATRKSPATRRTSSSGSVEQSHEGAPATSDLLARMLVEDVASLRYGLRFLRDAPTELLATAFPSSEEGTIHLRCAHALEQWHSNW